MKYTLYDRLLQRELGTNSRYSKIRALYGDRRFVDDLDIVNELGGHSGCVNALSWSRSGKLLASGSDDQHVNIHSYQPESSTSQFELTTTVATGHRANIFSVKFMPHSNDRTLVTAAGDNQVRIFDIEYAGRSTTSSEAANLASASRTSRSTGQFNNGVRRLSDGDTNAKVFKSHSDRVKRIVTESSPWLFLTCSEDGEVRQWDIRQPSSAYPDAGAFGRRSFGASRDDNIPPPLISYKRYHLDLNTISCSPSQPHYIALGGAHLHCFLHDRRMTGRDRLAERGASLAISEKSSNHDDELMNQATQCVRKFAPNGQKRMKRVDNGHITACKISDANPNEMVVSWSGEWIYSFDLVHSPDAGEEESESTPNDAKSKARVKDSTLRKRKRTRTGVSQGSTERPNSRPRTESEEAPEEEGDMSLMVRYENGQSEEIPIEPPRPRSPDSEARETENRGQSFRIAKQTVNMRKNLFTLGARKEVSDSDPTGYAVPFSTVLGLAATILPQMDEIMRTWRYPVNPSEVDVRFQNNLREKRSSARRFVQATGTVARVLGGRLRTAGEGPSPILSMFEKITPAPREPKDLPRHEQFSLDFLKAILLWLESGVGALLEGFVRPNDQSTDSRRFPVPEDASIDAIDEHLIPYLLGLAGETPIVNLDASPFEVDNNRYTFETEKAAVLAFSRALKIPFADLSSAVVPASPEGGSSAPESIGAQDRKAALRFWGFKIGRGLLMNAGEGINFAFVDRAFGGLGRPDAGVKKEEVLIQRALRVINPDEEDPVVESASAVRRTRVAEESSDEAEAASSSEVPHPTVEETEDDDDSDPIVEEGVLEDSEIDEVVEFDDDEDGDAGDTEEDEDDDDEDDDDDDEEAGPSHVMFRSAFERTRLKEKAELDKPCSPHTRMYRGHCNVKTVKDVNFYGLQDEYVVSGSDSGHLFIWDKKTTQIVNILEADGEVVNVVTGHPYEPIIAASGIDHTIKIFSADARDRENARLGVGVSPGDMSTFSSISLGRLRRRQRPTSHPANNDPQPSQAEGDEPEEDAVALGGLPSRRRIAEEYRITTENDVTRAGGNRDAFITRGLLAELAQRFYLNPNAGDDEGDEGGGPQVLVEGDQCAVM